jgi:hypothetical protein
MQSRGKIVVSALAASTVALVLGFTGCTSILGDFDVAPGGGENDGGEGGPGSDTGPSAGSNGATCATAADCTSGFCVDGVCCESKCDGVCESCNGTNKGKCDPVAAKTDPDNECQPKPLPDAGTPDAGDLDGGDAGEGGADFDSGVHLPDSGVTAADTNCKGLCDGNRACKYPGKETSCGTQFCNTTEERGGYTCDEGGHCNLDIQACNAYSCVGTDCKKNCAAPGDCLSTHYCDGPSNSCKPKLADSINCATPDQCQSGFCVNSVCCDSACTDIPGAVCNKPGKVGSCQCSLSCNAGASCIVVYPDSDNDTFGDRVASLTVKGVGGNFAQIACSDAIPTGFVEDHTDCADNDGRAHPNGGAQGTPINGTANNYDFNCDGVTTKTIAETNGFCGFCTAPDATRTCAPPQTNCTTTGQIAKFQCPLSSLFFCPIGGGPCSPSYSCGGPFTGSNRTSFTTTVNCGATGTTKTCGSCSGAGLPDNQGDTTTPGVQQTCR